MIGKDSNSEPESIWNKRRKAPFHFLSKADNARMSAYVLFHTKDGLAADLASAAGYKGSTCVALGEGFIREASIALELILKAIVCIKRKAPPPNTHDIYGLWSQAGLPALSNDDSYRLVVMTQTLYWSGRYAAPKSDKDFIKSETLLKKFQRTKTLGQLRVVMSTPLGWSEFNALYQIAHDQFWQLDPNDPENFVA